MTDELIAKDFLGRILSVGDTIVFASSIQGLKIGTITKIRLGSYHYPEIIVETAKSEYKSFVFRQENIYLVQKGS